MAVLLRSKLMRTNTRPNMVQKVKTNKCTLKSFHDEEMSTLASDAAEINQNRQVVKEG